MSAITTMTLCTASQIFTLTTAPERQRSTVDRVFTWIHRAGFMVFPFLGILSNYPEVIGVNERDFSRVVRTPHLSIGYVTALSYTITFSLD